MAWRSDLGWSWPELAVLRGHEFLKLSASFQPGLVLERHRTTALPFAQILSRMFAAAASPLANVEAVAGVFFRRGASSLPGALVHLGLALVLALIEAAADVGVADQQQILVIRF